MAGPKKSYSGCWTCRERKVKCDLGRPTCQRCERQRLKCGGYGVRLRWAGEEKRENDFRSNIEFTYFPRDQRFDSYNDLESALEDLESVMPIESTVSHGPFGVFPSQKSSNPDVFQIQRPLTPAENEEKSLDSNGTEASPPMDNLWELESYGNLDNLNLTDSNFEMFISEINGNINETSLGADAQSLLFEDSSPVSELTIPLPASMGNNLSFKRLRPANHMLLSYFHNHFMTLMPIIKHSDNFFRAEFTPRAIDAIGDIMLMGHTSNSRNCILYGAEAIAAYHLARKFSTNSAEQDQYLMLAMRYQKVARSSLNECFRGDEVGKYQDLLIAVQLMVLAERVTSGPDADKLLVSAQRLVNLRLRNQPKMSDRDRMIHQSLAISVLLMKVSGSVFNPAPGDPLDDDGWLDTIFEYFSPFQSDVHEDVKTLGRKKWLNVKLDYMKDPLELDEYFSQYTIDPLTDRVSQSLELTWGLPNSLVYLFKETVLISEAALNERKRQPLGFLDDKLVQKSTALEAAFENWHKHYTPPSIHDSAAENSPAGKQARRLAIINHHTLAFFDCLVLYHYRAVKGVNPELLQRFVLSIIQHLDAITYLNKTYESVTSVPFLFVGFVGACEVSGNDNKLRQRYERWFMYMQENSLCDRGEEIKLVEEVHSRRREGQLCDWWNVAEDLGITLYLY